MFLVHQCSFMTPSIFLFYLCSVSEVVIERGVEVLVLTFYAHITKKIMYLTIVTNWTAFPIFVSKEPNTPVDSLALHIESLIFVANPSISFDDIKGAVEEALGTTFIDEQINSCILAIEVKYANGDYSFELVEIGGGFRFMTKASYHNTIGTYLKQNTNKKLSKSALETLSIIAYKQPTTKSEVESIRGV